MKDKNKKVETYEKKKKKQQIMALTLATLLGVSALAGLGASMVSSGNEISNPTSQKQEEEKDKEIEYYQDNKVILDVDKMISDMESVYNYEFDKQLIEDGVIQEFKDKKSALKLFSPVEKDLIFPYIMSYHANMPYDSFIKEFDVTTLPLMDFVLDRELGTTKTELVADVTKIVETEKTDKGGKDEKVQYYNLSYNVVQDIYLNFYFVSDGETVQISYDMEDVNPMSIVYIRDFEKIDEVAYVNKFKPSISLDGVSYQKRIAKDYFEYFRDFSTDLSYFSFMSLEPLEKDLLNAQVSYLTALLLDSLDIMDSKEEKEYVIKYVNEGVQQFLEKGSNGMIEVPMELFLWSFTFNITGTENQYKVSFNDIKYLDDFDGKYQPKEEVTENQEEVETQNQEDEVSKETEMSEESIEE